MGQQVRWVCPEPCGVRFAIGAETTLNGYHRQPWLSHMVVDCPNCKKVFTRFVTPDIILRAIESMDADDKCQIRFDDYAPDCVIHEFARQYHVPAITEDWRPTDDRSKRRQTHDDNEVGFFHYLLDREPGIKARDRRPRKDNRSRRRRTDGPEMPSL